MFLAAQALYGYLPELVFQHLHEKTGIPLGRIYGVVKFYARFNLTLRGRHIALEVVEESLAISGGATESHKSHHSKFGY